MTPPSPRRIGVVGATGYIGQHVVRELVARGHEVVALVRPGSRDAGGLVGAELLVGNVASDRPDPAVDEFVDGCEAIVSCVASRTGLPDDAWRVDYGANRRVLDACLAHGTQRFVLLSAICVQRPRLAFQQAKRRFERELESSGLRHSIVRPTAFFKSLAGQIEAVRRGGPFTVLGDGTRTACKPIGEPDLARFLADCLDDPRLVDRILPVGGPGAPITPRQQGELLFELLGRTPRFRQVPVRALDWIAGSLGAAARAIPSLRGKAELAQIGRYYANESMLVWNAAESRYDAAGTPSFGTETLRDFYARAIRDGLAGQELGAHAVFDRSATPLERSALS